MTLPNRPLGLLLLGAIACASPLDWVAGAHDLSWGAVPDPTDGLAVSRWSIRFDGPGSRLAYRYQNEVPLVFRRRQQHAGRLETIDHQFDFDTVAGGAAVGVSRRQSRNLAELTAGDGANQALWRQQDTSVVYQQRLTPRLRLGWGYDDERHDLGYETTSAVVQAAASQYQGGFRLHRLWSGFGTDLGTLEAGLSGAFRWQAGEVTTRLAGRDVGAPLNSDGYQLAAWVSTPLADGWRLRTAGSWRAQDGSESLRVGAKRYGRSSASYEEWRAALELRGELNPAVTVTACLFQRSLRSDLAGHITAIAPPLGSLAGPRYNLESHAYWRQTGLAAGVLWQAAPRTRCSFSLRSSWGRVYAGYQVTEKSGPTATPEDAGSTSWDQNLWLGVTALTLEQRVGAITFGARSGLAVGLANDRQPPEAPGPGGGDSFNLVPGVPFAFWCSTTW